MSMFLNLVLFLVLCLTPIESINPSLLEYLYRKYGKELSDMRKRRYLKFGLYELTPNLYKDNATKAYDDWVYMFIREVKPRKIIKLGQIDEALTWLALSALATNKNDGKYQVINVDINPLKVVKKSATLFQSLKSSFGYGIKDPDAFDVVERATGSKTTTHYLLSNHLGTPQANNQLLTWLKGFGCDSSLNATSSSASRAPGAVDMVVASASLGRLSSAWLDALTALSAACVTARPPRAPAFALLVPSDSPAARAATRRHLDDWARVQGDAGGLAVHRDELPLARLAPHVPYPPAPAGVASPLVLHQFGALKQPRLLLVTPESRGQAALDAVARTVTDWALVLRWVVVHSESGAGGLPQTPAERPSASRAALRAGASPLVAADRVVELDFPLGAAAGSMFGNLQRAAALRHLGQRFLSGHPGSHATSDGDGLQDSLVYFLDDDNALHPNLFWLAHYASLPRLMLLQQRWQTGRFVHPRRCKVFHVDTGSVMASLRFLFNISWPSSPSPPPPGVVPPAPEPFRWDPTQHEADGLFFEQVCRRHPARVELVGTSLSCCFCACLLLIVLRYHW